MDSTRKELLISMGFSEKAVSILDEEINMGQMENPTLTIKHQGSCGDILILALNNKNQTIGQAMYEYIGCAGLQACAPAMTELVKGLTLSKAKAIDVQNILDYLEGIPDMKYECAEIASDTLHKAIDQYEAKNV
ncbi:MAG: iron-sulfur cluster assembly scaffold protein [Caldithrix sp.]|nr:iron-sulfur cluster assembly scaffold protein [Caldithrix sp.]